MHARAAAYLLGGAGLDVRTLRHSSLEGPASMCGRYVTPGEAAMERAYDLTARQWEAWMDEAYRPSYNVAPSRLRTG